MDEDKMRERILDINMTLAGQSVENQRSAGAELYRSIIEYGKQTLNGLLLLNGASAVAIVHNKESLECSWVILLLTCSLGAVFAVISSGVAYFAQREHYRNYMENSEIHLSAHISRFIELYLEGKTKTEIPILSDPKKPKVLTSFAVGGATASLVCFVYAFSQFLREF